MVSTAPVTSVKCLGGDCEEVFGTIRVNISSTDPGTAMNSTYNSTPFVILEINSTNASYITNEWNSTIDIGSTDRIFDIAIDKYENAYVVGMSRSNTRDWEIKKFNKNSTVMWSKTYNISTNDQASGIALDSGNNVYVAGRAGNNWTVHKLTDDGTNEWNKTYSLSANINIAYEIAIDSSDNIYVVGSENNIYWRVMKINTTGHSTWNRTYDFNGSAFSVGIDNLDNIYVGGYKNVSSNSKFEEHAMKIDSDGLSLWNNTYTSGTAKNVINQVLIDGINRIYLIGGDAGSADPFTIREIDIDGNTIRTVHIDAKGGTGGETGIGAQSAGTDTSGNIYMAGTSSTDVVMEIKKINDEFNLSMNRFYPKTTDLIKMVANAITIDRSGNMYVGGSITDAEEDWFLMKFDAYHNPAGCGSLSGGCAYNFKINATSIGKYQIDVLYNTTLAGVEANSTSGINISVQ